MSRYLLSGLGIVISTAIVAIFRAASRSATEDSVSQSVLNRIRIQEPFDASR